MTEESLPTKDRLLDAAEQLFARKDFGDVSIRELALAAGVNVAAVNYHFHSKENLFQEVCSRRFSAQRDRTLKALEAILAESGPNPSVDKVIATFVRQYLEGTLATDGGPGFLMAVSRELHVPGAQDHGGMFKNMIQPVFRSFSTALKTAEPELKPQQLAWIIPSIVGQIHHFIMRWVKKESMDPGSEAHTIMVETFPVLKEPLPVYIDEVTAHITSFSSTAISGLNRKEKN